MKTALSSIVITLMLAVNSYALTYTFNDWNYNGTTGNYGTVDITKNLNGDIYFTVTANTSFFSGDLTWDKFFFNYKGATPLTLTNFKFTGVPGNWNVTTGGNASTFGVFDNEAKGTGIGNSVIDPLQFYYDTPVGITLSESDFVDVNSRSKLFEAHLRRIDSPAYLNGSVQLAVSEETTSVPEPGTMMLLSAGIFGLAIYGKRRNRK